MRVSMASVAAGRVGRGNEDFAGAAQNAAVLVDGAGIPGMEAVCRHGVAWYAARLGATILRHIDDSTLADTLADVLAVAIRQVTDQHRDTCDVADPISPSAAVAIVRVTGGRVEHLVLGDAFVVLDRGDAEPVVVTDPREPAISRVYAELLKGVPEGSDEYRRILRELRANRNHPGGFWVAKDDPRAAHEAITGSCPVQTLTGAALLSNGASRIVGDLGLTDWRGVMAMLGRSGPREIIRRVRQAEARHGIAADDATVAHCTGLAAGIGGA
ncbi:protein phosphatase 2C domain-containing protein [Nonomuraea sp. NBC_01738]|uniref:protein phosphatase 2C domain-containing protein n=1 Tax=Nonomuraea sp. NBC_01738 TaxID=2976003 RepID=UPI002E11CF37|nr:protein phosphatase 2C domain-containing protein [Nonomuraea sp. NBC_01738]